MSLWCWAHCDHSRTVSGWVARQVLSQPSKAKVVLGKTRLVVTTDAGIKFEATPVLNVEGACKLVVNDSELDLWQVCRRALEDLFFE